MQRRGWCRACGLSPDMTHGLPPFPPEGWLPPGKSCAILFSIDDVHPARTSDGTDAGGDLAAGMLGHLLTLTAAHPELRTSLCTSPDWRARVPYPTRTWLARIGPIARHIYLGPRWPGGTFALDRHPEFIAFLKAIPGAEIVAHGLHHVRKGQPMPEEFGLASKAQAQAALAQVDAIMDRAGIVAAPGHSPPGWTASPAFRQAMRQRGQQFIASARDVRTTVSPTALTAMSGMEGQPLIFPGITGEGLIHIPVNFQATSTIDRALEILACGGLLSIKAHAIKRIGNYKALDGLDADYARYLDDVLTACKARFGDAIWWANMSEISARTQRARALAAAA